MASVAPAPGSSVRLFAQPRAGRAKLRVGVFADRALQPRWLVEALARVAASDFAEIAFVALGPSPASAEAAAVDEPLAWRAYRKLDRMLLGTGPDWSERRDVGMLVPASRRIAASGPGARGALAEGPVDVAFALGAVDDASLAPFARYGVWRYCFGDDHGIHESLAGVREVIDAAPVVASAIRIHRGDGSPDRIACPSWARTFPFSVARSREGVLAKSAEFAARSLRDLHAFGPAWLDHGTLPARPLVPGAFPRGPRLLGGLSRVGARVAQRTAEKFLTIGQWQLAFRFAAHEPWSGSLAGFTRLAPPKDRFWADPFPLVVRGRHYIFFEELPFASSKAHISVIEVDREGRASQPVRVLERDYHLSYPFLVEDEGELYMIPETGHNRAVEIYRCVEFPRRWKLEKTLVRDVWCADATLHRAGERWWMFATIGFDGGEVNDELHLFSADRLLGDWKPHRRNPVKSDVRSARPAGRLFRDGDRLLRPSQICVPLYGSGVALNRVVRLNDAEYVEEAERLIVPRAGEGLLGMHTLNRAGELSVTDAFVRRSRFPA